MVDVSEPKFVPTCEVSGLTTTWSVAARCWTVTACSVKRSLDYVRGNCVRRLDDGAF